MTKQQCKELYIQQMKEREKVFLSGDEEKIRAFVRQSPLYTNQTKDAILSADKASFWRIVKDTANCIQISSNRQTECRMRVYDDSDANAKEK